MFSKKNVVLFILYWGLTTPLYFYTNGYFQKETVRPKVVISKKINSSHIVSPTPLSTLKPVTKPIKKKIKPTVRRIDVVKPQTLSSSTVINTASSAVYKISAYDLSVQSCGKSRTSRGYGLTASGFSLRNHTRASAMTIAADLRRFKMGTKVYLKFVNSRVQKYNGIYTVRDTGGGIKRNKIDLFMGEGSHHEAMDFGVQLARVSKVN